MPRPGRIELAAAALYLVQGLVYGFFGYVLVPRLAAAGVSLEQQVTLVATLGLPWVVKPLFGWIFDRGVGRRGADPQTWAVGATFGVALVLALLGRELSELSATRLLGPWIAVNVLLGVQDVATDALVLRSVALKARGRANAWMFGAHHLGHAGLGGLLAGHAWRAWGGVGAAACVAGAIAAIALVVGASRGGQCVAHVDAVTRPSAPRVWLARLPLLIVAALVLAGDVATSAVAGEFMTAAARWSPEDIAEVLPPVELGAALVGHLLSAVLVDRLTHRRAAVLGSVALGVLWVVFSGLSPLWTEPSLIVGLVVVQALVTAVFVVGLHATLMDAANEVGHGATAYALLTASLNLPRLYAPFAAGLAVGQVGFAGLFAIAGIYQAIGVAMLMLLLPRRAS